MRRLISSKWKSRSCIWLLALMALMLMPSFMPSQTDVAGLEIPIYKGKLSQTIKRRTAYTVSYNHDTRQPNWVAWVLTREHASGNLPRADFEDDMDMPSPKGTKADYYNSGYDRGHMCPAGDNKWSQKAMNECFLMTNMCPQNHSLNAGVWNTIEQQCRTWAKKYGKVYIVCGPVFLNKQHRKLGKNKVLVPGHLAHGQESPSHRFHLPQSVAEGQEEK